MEKLTEVLAMNGFAAYVWPAFAAAAIILVGLVAVSIRSLRQAQSRLLHLQDADEA